MAGIGFDVSVVRELTPSFKRYLRSLAFPLVALKVYFGGDLLDLHLIDGDTTHVAQLAIVANGHYHGGDFKVAEDASLASGKLEVVLIEKIGCLLRADILARILAKRPLDRDAKSFPARDIQAESPGACVPVQTDGEVWGQLPMSFRIEPAAKKLVRELRMPAEPCLLMARCSIQQRGRRPGWPAGWLQHACHSL